MADWITKEAREFAARYVFECELMLEGEPVLIGSEGIEPLHTDDNPYCSDERCPCHYDGQLYAEFVLTPFMDGLLTFAEANALRWGENI